MPSALVLACLLSGCALPAEPLPPLPDAPSPMTEAPPPLDPAQARRLDALVGALRVGGPGCRATGAAVHLEGDVFVTAAHLVDGTQPMLRGCEVGSEPPRLAWRGREAPAVVQRTGLAEVEPGVGLRYIGGQDIALLRRPGTGARPLGARLCAQDPEPGQAVVVATGPRVVPSRILGLMSESIRGYGGYVELPLALEPGESGGGVFDTASGCLLGLVSHREAVGGEERTRIVSTAVLRRFVSQAETGGLPKGHDGHRPAVAWAGP